MQHLFEQLGSQDALQNVRAVGSRRRILHAILDPSASVGLAEVHEVGADTATVQATRGFGHIPRDVQFRVGVWQQASQRIQLRLQVAPPTKRIKDVSRSARPGSADAEPELLPFVVVRCDIGIHQCYSRC